MMHGTMKTRNKDVKKVNNLQNDTVITPQILYAKMTALSTVRCEKKINVYMYIIIHLYRNYVGHNLYFQDFNKISFTENR